MTRDKKVKSINALNDDAKDIIDEKLNDKPLDEAIKTITIKVIEKGYVKSGEVTILLHSTGNIKTKEIEKTIKA